MQMNWPTGQLTAILQDLIDILRDGGAPPPYDYTISSYVFGAAPPATENMLLQASGNLGHAPIGPFVSLDGTYASGSWAIRNGDRATAGFGRQVGLPGGELLYAVYGPNLAGFTEEEPEEIPGEPPPYDVKDGYFYSSDIGAGIFGVQNASNSVEDETAFIPNKLTPLARMAILNGTVAKLGVRADLVDASDTLLATWTWASRVAPTVSGQVSVLASAPIAPTVAAVASGTAAWLVFRTALGVETARADVGDSCYLGLTSITVTEGEPMTWGAVRLHSGGP
ncbi:hypothetical protein SAMN02949497_1673 [Methylomagnum ishizawai]|uniref:Uncharacterized protein n=1 Tax=Methylomagnum ishizawai TaxID=1760988 RepID=A0A1Y6D1B9_9GAMM|nr:hypothetical protein [Methylomagnum ishizawai]SMF94362.1 hypothetical protein SAMN02949497_1673 [Methylomagnum ishizawai]